MQLKSLPRTTGRLLWHSCRPVLRLGMHHILTLNRMLLLVWCRLLGLASRWMPLLLPSMPGRHLLRMLLRMLQGHVVQLVWLVLLAVL